MNSYSKNIRIPLEIFYDHLEDVNGIRFTPREIDVIACILNGRSAKTMPSLLSISAKTVATHLANIRAKTGCPSRESIIDFVEKSGELSLIKNDYYYCLLIQVFFENQIKGVSKQEATVSIVHGPDLNSQKAYVDKLKHHLELSGFIANTVVEQERENTVIYKTTAEGGETQVPLHSSDLDNYYAYFYSLLMLLMPLSDVHKMVDDFKAYLKCIENPNAIEYTENKPVSREKSRKSWVIGFGLFCCSLIFTTFLWNWPAPLGGHIRSDLILPSEMTLVNRSELITRIDDAFKNQKGIGSVAIVGIGGSGKTTLARFYGKQFKSSVMWEINAETQVSLLQSFEGLAEALTTTEDDKRLLRGLNEIKDVGKKQDKIITFVRERLKSRAGWLLIYDNVETYKDVEKYFPHDPNLWGTGSVIVTTRNATIHNMNGIVPIGELSQGQKLELYTQIMQHGADIKSDQAETDRFLKEIPPFPLDVSLAAYYIKSTNISYDKYIETLNANEEGFSGLQENILNESGNYNKTRYKIIALTIQKLITEHKGFRDLFLLLGLMDSQNIPKELLDRFKGDQVADSFIFNLNKYSLISVGTLSTPSDKTLSIHRSTQKIILDFLIPEIEMETIHSIASTLESYAYEMMDQENISKTKLLVSHCERVLHHNKLIEGEDWVLVGKELGWFYFYFGNYPKATETLKQCQKIIKDSYKNENRLLGTTVNFYLGVVYTEMNEREKAEVLLKDSLELYEKIKGKNDVMVAYVLQHLGIAEIYKGKYESARKSLERTYQILSEHYPENYLDIARVLVRLGDLNRELGNYNDAVLLLEQALTIYEGRLEKDHYRFGQTLVRMGLIYRDIGDYQKARDLLKKGRALYQKHFPSTCDKVAWVTGKLGQVEHELGNTEKARELLESSIHIYTKLYPEDFEIAWIKSYLAKICLDSGELDKAKTLLEESLVGHEDNYGKDHKDTAQIIRAMGKLSILQGDLETAEALLQKSLNICLTSNHPQAFMDLELLGELYLKRSQMAEDKAHGEELKREALSYFQQALAIVSTRFPCNSPYLKRLQDAVKKLEQ